MHDPKTVAHELKSPFKNSTPGGNSYRKTLVTIWHVDPETDGTDDSCGWFQRARHGDKDLLAKIKREFLFNHKHNYWFTVDGYRQFSTSGLVLLMYRAVLWEFFHHSHAKVQKFMNKHLYEILNFSENPYDCIGDRIVGKFGHKPSDEMIQEMAGIIYADVLRKTRPWYQHPRWHLHHWKIQIHWPRIQKRKHEQAYCDHNLRDTI